ncbi:MAG: hypothetical protein MI673_03915 [Thiotrichales bacterium]|nr:hypothetical protein [Thiotrichales bacterium]
MKHSIPAPDIDILESLIARAFDDLPGPDTARIQSIRDRFDSGASGTRSQKNPNRLPWWTVLLLTGGLATAAWWLDENRGTSEQSRPVPGHSASDTRLPITQEENLPLVPQEAHPAADDSPVIYQR